MRSLPREGGKVKPPEVIGMRGRGGEMEGNLQNKYLLIPSGKLNVQSS